ncbi:alpha/beta hydrolase family esterase [Gordonia desulfuricans]|uniref:alpha/beta hydrolase family esterase n=1 Tax=Gordonia desulfuricans TaxID=89051 RepID=UPI000B0FF1BB|nr:PHB depolymerase family esterase [Gordonia desulfuricans]
MRVRRVGSLWCGVVVVFGVVVSVLGISGLGVAGLGATAAASPAGAVTEVAACTTRTALAPGTTVRTTKVKGVKRSYRLHIPQGYNRSRANPLILAYHGHAENTAAFERYTGLSRLPAIVVYPTGLAGTDGTSSWQGAPYSAPKADDIAFTSAILREVRGLACVDRARTYAVGRSNGGGLVSMLTCRLPREFAAYAVVNPALYAQTWRACPSAPPASVISFHGTADPVIHYAGGVRFGSRYTGIADATQTWARRAGCVPVPITTPVNGVVVRENWPLCSSLGEEIVHYRISGGSHLWPGSAVRTSRTGPSDSISATSLIWQFFGRHPAF